MDLSILPAELLKEIAQWLTVKDLLLLGSTSKKWFNAKSYSWVTTASIHDIPSHNNYAILEKLASIEDLDNDPDPYWMDNIREAPALIPQLTSLSKLKKLRCGIYPRIQVPGSDINYITDQINILKQLTMVEQLALSVSNMIPRAYGIDVHDICNNLTRLTSLSLLAGFLEDRDYPWAIFSQLYELELQFMTGYQDEYFGSLSIETGTNLTKLVITNYAYSSYDGQMVRISHLTRLKCLEIACPTPALIDGTDLTRLSHLRELVIGYSDSEDNRLLDIIPYLESLHKLRVPTLDPKYSSLTNLSHLILDSRNYDNQKHIIDNVDSLMKMTALRRLDLPYTDELAITPGFIDTLVTNVTQLQRIYTPVHGGRGRCHYVDHRSAWKRRQGK